MLKEIANSVRSDAVVVVQNALDFKDEDAQVESEMKQMYNDDAKDLLHVADLIEQGKIEEAAKFARNMDTAARENINQNAWDFINE